MAVVGVTDDHVFYKLIQGARTNMAVAPITKESQSEPHERIRNAGPEMEICLEQKQGPGTFYSCSS